METNREIDELRDAVKRSSAEHCELVNVINIISQDLKEIKMAVIGSDQLGIEGIVKKVEKHEQYINIDKKQKWSIAGGTAVIVFIITFLITLFKH